ncbi:MAG: ATP-binding protein [Armatimonadota bacterium]|jgi:two-component system sensor histidine kinase ResE
MERSGARALKTCRWRRESVHVCSIDSTMLKSPGAVAVSIDFTREEAGRGVLDPAGDPASEMFFEVSMVRALGTVRVALVLLMMVVVFATPTVTTLPAAAFLALFVGSILTIWTRFAARWRELEVAGHVSTAAGVVLIGDVLWTSLFVLGTGGLDSPFLALLFIPIIFGCAFFSVLELAAALVTGLVSLIIFTFGIAAEQTVANIWRTSGMIFASIAVAWVAYGLARVLERERQTNELVVRHMSEAVVLIDSFGVIRLVNPPLLQLTGLDHDSLVGLAVDELPPGEKYEVLRQIVGDPRTPDGPASPYSVRDIQVEAEKPCDLRVYAVRMGGTGRAAGRLIICQDVTDLKSVARARETGVRFLSHEMRSPLSTLKIISQIFGELTDQLTDSNADRLVTLLDSETDRMLRMVGQFLDLAALDQGTFRLALQKINVAHLMHRVCNSLEFRAADKDMTVEKSLPDALPLISADPDRLEDVLHNLCDNALKYTDRGGTIRLSAREADGMVELCVSDNGQGISPEIQDDIFSEFVRAAEDGQSGRKMGVGLGLYMARRIVEEHGGEITVDSAIGRGSDFVIRLPVA